MTTYATNITPFAAPARNRTGPLAATVTGAIAPSTPTARAAPMIAGTRKRLA